MKRKIRLVLLFPWILMGYAYLLAVLPGEIHYPFRHFVKQVLDDPYQTPRQRRRP